MDQRQVEQSVPFRQRQPRHRRRKIHHKRYARLGGIRQAENAQTTHLQQSNQRRRRARNPESDVDTIVRNQLEPMATQPQHQIGLPRSWRSHQ
jgi:membrane peptidoglycan carboxypeptidase